MKTARCATSSRPCWRLRHSDEAESKLKLWAKYSDSDGGVLENVIAYQPGEKPQRTLVLIKPENFRFPSGRPGNVIDFFSRTGLFIVGIKVHRMSVAQALEFYGPVREVLRTKLKDMVAGRAQGVLEKEFGFKIPAEAEKQLGDILGPAFRRQSIREHRQVHVRPRAFGIPARKTGKNRAVNVASRWCMKAWRQCARSATFWDRPILPRRLPDRSGASSGKR